MRIRLSTRMHACARDDDLVVRGRPARPRQKMRNAQAIAVASTVLSRTHLALAHVAQCALDPRKTDNTTISHCVKTKMTLVGCQCVDCEAPYHMIGHRLCPLCPLMPPSKCWKIAHCAEMEFCSDCGCSEHWCCDQCEANWTATGGGSEPDECVCEPPRVERNDTCVI